MRILRPWQVYGKEGRTGLSKSTVRRKEMAGEFPARVKIGENSVGWLEDEVNQWIAEQAAKRDARPIERHDDRDERATESVS